MDYSEQFCKAVDAILAERLRALEFDKTILCTIQSVSAFNKKEYTVSTDGSTFKAYSQDNVEYKKND
jgi:hypothetical protein